MHRFESQPAYILHARAYQESSLLLELFSRDYGRISAIAKGVKRKTKGGMGGILQPFIPLLIACRGKGELLTLKSFEAESAYLQLMGKCLVSALYLNELLMRLLYRWDAHADLFYIYRKTLLDLQDNSQPRDNSPQPQDTRDKSQQVKSQEVILRLFEKALLKAIGYELQLHKEVDSGNLIDPGKYYLFNPEQGPSCVSKDNPHYLGIHKQSSQTQKLLFRGKSLLDLEAESLSDPISLQDAKRLMREALARHLGVRPLETRKLFL